MNKIRPSHNYFPTVEGFGETYRRVVLNEFFEKLISASEFKDVAEMPLDDYGVVGAGSLIFAQLGCRVHLVSDDLPLLQQGCEVFKLNRLEEQVRPVHTHPLSQSVPDDHYDLGWNFDRLLTQASPDDFLSEMVRVCKVVFICVPNARNYGQYFHFVYHKLAGTSCAYVEPRKWMIRSTIRRALESLGMEVVDEGLIDVPWWPGFPELPDLVRSVFGRRPIGNPLRQQPIPPATAEAEQQWLDKVHKATFIEHSGLPEVMRQLFAHNIYVLAAKPKYKYLIKPP